MENSVKERTLAFVKYLGISMKTFEQECDLSTGYVTSMRKGFGSEKLNNVLTAYPDLNRDWLLYGEGPMLKAEEEQGGAMVPLLPMTAAAGPLCGFDDSVTAAECEKIPAPVRNAEFAITISGDSMTPDFPSGCIVFIKKVQERLFFEWGKVYVLATEDGSVLKKLMPTKEKDVVSCVSVNPDYPPFELNLSSVRGIYSVLGVFVYK